MLSGKDVASDEKLCAHADWAAEVLAKHPEFCADNADEIIRAEVGAVFEKVLCDAGVFKWNKTGIDAFKRFCLCL